MPATLVLIHALTQDERAWDMLALDSGCAPAVHTPVLPGHGARPRHPSFTLTQIADEIAGATSGPLDLVGVAVGGIVAQHLMVRHPGRVASAVLACTTGSSAAAEQQMLSRAAEAERSGMAPLTDTLLRRWFTPAAIAANGPGVCYARDRIGGIDPAAYADTLRAFARHDLLERLPGCTQPVTLITGADDEVGRGSQDKLAAYLPRHRRLTLPGAHMLHLERPGPLRAAILSHLSWARTEEAA